MAEDYYSNSSGKGKLSYTWIVTPNPRKGAKEQVEELLMLRLLDALEIVHKYKINDDRNRTNK